MSENPPERPDHGSADWAPYDYTDGKKKGEWESGYSPEARKCIRLETAYLIILTILCLVGVFWVIYSSAEISAISTSPTQTLQGSCQPFLIFLGYFGALLAGILGGCCFGIKCMYHFVAKLMWHEDRRLWRLLTPLGERIAVTIKPLNFRCAIV